MSNDTRDIVKEKFNEHSKYIKDQISQKRKVHGLLHIEILKGKNTPLSVKY